MDILIHGKTTRRNHALALAAATLLLGAAHRPPPPAGELVLDAATPMIAVEVAGVPLRLRVDLDARDTVELNPAAAARLPIRWEEDVALDVGRVRLAGRAAAARLRVAGGERSVQVAEHGRDCCADADGTIAPGLLPYATVRWRRNDALPPTGTRTVALDETAETGLSAAADPGQPPVRIRFAPAQAETSATAAAGAVLARALAGHWDGSATRLTLAFAVSRPVRPLRLARPALLAGFPVERLPVRLADFGGGAALPQDPPAPDEIVVRHKVMPQRAWPAVTLGADRLDRCAEITYSARPRTLTLACAFVSG